MLLGHLLRKRKVANEQIFSAPIRNAECVTKERIFSTKKAEHQHKSRRTTAWEDSARIKCEFKKKASQFGAVALFS